MQKLFKPGATFEARVKNIDFIIENLFKYRTQNDFEKKLKDEK